LVLLQTSESSLDHPYIPQPATSLSPTFKQFKQCSTKLFHPAFFSRIVTQAQQGYTVPSKASIPTLTSIGKLFRHAPPTRCTDDGVQLVCSAVGSRVLEEPLVSPQNSGTSIIILDYYAGRHQLKDTCGSRTQNPEIWTFAAVGSKLCELATGNWDQRRALTIARLWQLCKAREWASPAWPVKYAKLFSLSVLHCVHPSR